MTGPVAAVSFNPRPIVRRASEAQPPLVAYRDPPKPAKPLNWRLLLAFAGNCAAWGYVVWFLFQVGG